MAETKKSRPPIDLDALVAEAAEEPVVYNYGGEQFTCPVIEDWPVDVVDLFYAGQVKQAMRGAMGDDQWERFEKHKPPLRALRILVEQSTGQAGVGGPGNS